MSGHGPLEGVRVLDLTRLLPGDFATSHLADLGAEVIKVEQPGTGDYMRWDEPRIGGESAHNWVVDRGKKSIGLNLKEPAAVEALKLLAGTADLFFESFRPGVTERLGVGYEKIAAVNPAIVYCSLSGFGQDGPDNLEAGHDLNYAARAGVTGIGGWSDGPPAIPGVQVADLGGGALMSLVGMLAALVRARATGEGDYVDISMTDGAFSWLSIHMGDHFADGRVPEREHMLLNGLYPCYNVYRCADGLFLTCAAVEEKFWANVCEAVGEPARVADHFDPDAVADWREIFARRARGEWLEAFAGRDTCVGPVNDFAEAASDPQLLHREMVVEREDRDGAVHRQVGSPIKMRNRPAVVGGASPRIGEHTYEVLTSAGLTGEEVEALVASGAAEAGAPA